MRVSRALTFVGTVMSVLVISLPACSRHEAPADAAVTSTRSAPPDATPRASAAADRMSAAASDPLPEDSGLSIQRGIATLLPARTTFRACDDSAELWLLDQGATPLMQALGIAPGVEADDHVAVFYIEARGERAPVAEDVPQARGYAGMFVLEELLYAGVPGDTRGCSEPAPDAVVGARGNEPFWAVEVDDTRVTWRQPQAPQTLELGAPEVQYAEGTVRYRAAAAGHEIELLVTAAACRDSMSGEFFAYTARAVLDGTEFSGCARVAR